MRSFLTRGLALALVLIFTVGMLPAAYADEDVRIRDTAYSETQGLRAAMTGKVSDTANFAVYGPDGELTISEVIEGEKNIYTIVTAEPLDVTAPYTLTYGADGKEVRMPIWYSTDDFEEQYTYNGDDLVEPMPVGINPMPFVAAGIAALAAILAAVMKKNV